MDGSGTIRILKRDGSAEEFDPHRLAAAIWRAMSANDGGLFRDAADLAVAIGVYLQRGRWACISSAAVFEMTVKVLRRVRYDEAAAAMEAFRFRRSLLRRHLKIEHDTGQITYWEKSWLARLGGRSWNLSARTARIIAAVVEHEMLSAGRRVVSRSEINDRFNDLVAQYGLADAVPITG